MDNRFWDGKTVHFTNNPRGAERRSFELSMTEKTARKLALALARLKQTTFALPDETQEVLDALNYVLVADPASVRAHQTMEAGKGMTPDGGFKFPNPPRDGRGLLMPGKAQQVASAGHHLDPMDPEFEYPNEGEEI